ncbi:hypothetical protein [Halalkalibacter alkalisediminis]|uniref:Uncharacterized protein n=1 Tax=Halalkalibacter alkalisediminis TaxID=935616 RepID=A0ABV6NE07_9BACI|nr:hypothetical protein [Halalkalibacter alkalisediminis]
MDIDWMEWQKKIIRDEHVVPELMDEKMKKVKRNPMFSNYVSNKGLVKNNSSKHIDSVKYNF